jgi:hypothetical protein
MVDPALDPQQLSHNPSEEQAAQNDQDVVGLQGELKADHKGHQTQAVHDRLTHPFRQAGAQQQPQRAAYDDGDDVDESTYSNH